MVDVLVWLTQTWFGGVLVGWLIAVGGIGIGRWLGHRRADKL